MFLIRTPHWLCRSSMWNFSMMANGTISLHPLSNVFSVSIDLFYILFFPPCAKMLLFFFIWVSYFFDSFFSNFFLWLFSFILSLHQLHCVVWKCILCHTVLCDVSKRIWHCFRSFCYVLRIISLCFVFVIWSWYIPAKSTNHL